MVAILKKDKETKNTIRFQGETDETIHLNIYLTKSEVQALGNPEKVKLTIEAA